MRSLIAIPTRPANATTERDIKDFQMKSPSSIKSHIARREIRVKNTTETMTTVKDIFFSPILKYRIINKTWRPCVNFSICYNKNAMSLVTIEKLNKDVAELKGDMHQMKEFLFTPLKDLEGEYKESFVKKMLMRSLSNGPFYRFSGKESFLSHVRTQK